MGDLTRNFSRFEFVSPDVGLSELIIDPQLPQALQKLRDLLRKPIYITSAYRTVAHNKEVGGTAKSQHLWGRAADIVVPGLSLDDVAEKAKTITEFRNGGIGLYPSQNFVHLDVRGWCARWTL